MYVPVLKVREAETEALASAGGHRGVMPLFEFVEHDSRGLGAETLFCLEQICDAWAASCFVDLGQLVQTPGDRAFVWDLATFWLSRQQVAWVLPCVDPADDPAVHQSAGRTAALGGGAALRVDAATAAPAALPRQLSAAVASLGLPRGVVHLLIDWRDLPSVRALDDLERETRALLAAAGGGWASRTVVGTAAAPGPSGVGPSHRTRREWWLWLRLARGSEGSPTAVGYGDYAGFEAPKPGAGFAKIPTVRYTGAMTMTIYRERNGAGRTDPTGLHKCAVQIVRSSEYSGAAFSDGDRAIFEAAQDPTAKANATGWRRMALQHHLTLVQDQLRTPPPAPPAGTR